MLGFLLIALKITGIALISILAFFLVLILLILFVPVKYKADLQKYEAFSGNATVSWLFGILKLAAVFGGDGGTKVFVKMFGIRISTGKKRSVPQKEQLEERREGGCKDSGDGLRRARDFTNTSENTADIGAKGFTNASENTADIGAKRFTNASENTADIGAKGFTNGAKGLSGGAKKTKKPFGRHKKSAAAERKKREGAEILKKLMEYENKREILGQTVIFLKRFIRAVSEFRLFADIKIGMSDPSAAGMLSGAISAAAGALHLNVCAKPDFDGNSITGRAQIKGGIVICSVLWVIILFIFNKNIFRLLKKIAAKKER